VDCLVMKNKNRNLRRSSATDNTQSNRMSSTILDQYIQDFVLTNKVLGYQYSWPTLVSRRFVESGAQRKVFQFQSGSVTEGGDASHYAVGTLLELPDCDVFRIELIHPAARSRDEHRLDCLRMMSATTHNQITSRKPDEGTVIIQLTTRNRGLINVVFVVRDGLALPDPVLCG
jgi:hypothetical protein